MNIDKHLDYLEQAEGIEIHYNHGEKDITLPYGLYKQYNSELYRYIIEIAELNGITKPSSQWNREDIKKVNHLTERGQRGVREYAKNFYKELIRKMNLSLYPKCCQDLIFSLYTNSSKYCVMAVQRSIIKQVSSNRLGLIRDEISTDDGLWGNKTRDSLAHILSHKTQDYHFYFEESIINNMEDIYQELAEEEHLKHNLKGWRNRVNYFASKE